jgi:hypothetical protein
MHLKTSSILNAYQPRSLARSTPPELKSNLLGVQLRSARNNIMIRVVYYSSGVFSSIPLLEENVYAVPERFSSNQI